MNVLILFIGVIISLTYFMSFVWEMKLEKKRKEKELFDDKNELIEIDDEYHAKQLTQLIHEHAPHLIVRSSVQQVDAS